VDGQYQGAHLVRGAEEAVLTCRASRHSQGERTVAGGGFAAAAVDRKATAIANVERVIRNYLCHFVIATWRGKGKSERGVIDSSLHCYRVSG